MSIAKKNAQVSAFCEHVTASRKNSPRSFIEWQIAINTKGATEKEPGRKVWGQKELCMLYPSDRGGHCGATKRTHTTCHTGNEFKHIVVKRFKKHGLIFGGHGTGNQIIDEIKCWEKFAETADADFLCPILKFFTCKSDKVTAVSEKMLEKCLIIAQKAVHVDDAKSCCRVAERMNKENGFHGETASDRFDKLVDMANRQGWWDAIGNGGNSGVIFDYARNCYKAVFIDYAL